MVLWEDFVLELCQFLKPLGRVASDPWCFAAIDFEYLWILFAHLHDMNIKSTMLSWARISCISSQKIALNAFRWSTSHLVISQDFMHLYSDEVVEGHTLRDDLLIRYRVAVLVAYAVKLWERAEAAKDWYRATSIQTSWEGGPSRL